MDIFDVKQQIHDKQLRNMYIFTGDELEVMSRYVHKISEVSGKAIQMIDKVSEITPNVTALFPEYYCYVCRDDSDFMKAESAWEHFDEFIGDNILILKCTKVDKRSKFYKYFEEQIVTFDFLNPTLLTLYLRRDTDLSEDACQELVAVCENNYSAILLEWDKIKSNKAYTSDYCLRKLLDDGAIQEPFTDTVYDFADAVVMGKPKKSFALYQRCYDNGEGALKLLSALYTNFKRVLQVQSCTSKDIAQSTGLTDQEVYFAKQKVGVYGNGEIVHALRLIQGVEIGIKSGKVDEEIAVPYVLVNVL